MREIIKEVSAKVIKLATDFSSRIEELEAKEKIRDKTSLTDFVRIFLDKPEILAMATFLYAAVLYLLMFFRRKIRRDRFIRAEFEDKYMDDYVRERNEFMHEKHRNKFHDDE